MNKDLTVGNPTKVLWLYCLPLLGSVLFQQFYNIADGVIAGKFISENALAAVGNSSEIILIFSAFAFGCNVGTSIVVSEFFGARKYRDMKSTVYTSFISSGIICLILMIFGIFASGAILNLMNTPADTFADSVLYLDIYVYGLPFVFFYNVSTGIFSALGDSKTPFIFLAISSVSNILMNIYFVKGLGMGVDGLAWATFICQGISCIFAISFLFKRLKGMSSPEKPKLFDCKILKKILNIAIPSTLQQSFISVGNILVQGIVNGFGPAVMAGYTASIKLNSLAMSSFTTIGSGLSNYTAQNIGAQRPERIPQGFRAGLKMVWSLCLPIVLLYCFAGKSLMHAFIENPSAEALSSGFAFLCIVSPFYFVISSKLLADGILRGAELMKYFMIATMTAMVIRVILATILSKTSLGSIGIWCAWPLGWIAATAISIGFYRTKISKKYSKQIQ